LEEQKQHVAKESQYTDALFSPFNWLQTDIASLRTEMVLLRQGFKQEIGDLRQEVKQEIGELRREIKQTENTLRQEIKMVDQKLNTLQWWIAATLLTVALTTIGSALLR